MVDRPVTLPCEPELGEGQGWLAGSPLAITANPVHDSVNCNSLIVELQLIPPCREGLQPVGRRL
jgi:hypothetical protein